MPARVSRPITVNLPAHGIVFAESMHRPGFRMADRADAFHKVLYVLQGRVQLHVHLATVPVSAGPGAILCIPAGLRHRLTDDRTSTLLLLCFSPDVTLLDPGLAPLWTDLAPPGQYGARSAGVRSNRLEQLWQSGTVEQLNRQPGWTEMLRATAITLLINLARIPAAAPGEDSVHRVASVVRDLEQTFYEPWNLARACAQASLSRRRFCTMFRLHTGQTFLERLTELRLNHAARLLRDHHHSVTGAAFSSGYEDLSHFYRLFRARFGAPPGGWLKKNHA